MAYPVTLQQLVTRALQRTNLEGAYAELLPFEELTDYANTSIAAWYDEVRGTTWNGAYYRAPFTITTTGVQGNQAVNPPSNAIYSLPADFLACTSVDCFVSPNTIITATAFQEEERNMYRYWTGAVGWYIGCDIQYQIQGSGTGEPYIVLMPPPQSMFQVQVNYVPVAPRLSSADASIDSINGWEEFIVENMAVLCLLKTGRTAEIPVHQQRLEIERGRIRKLAPRRDMQNAERVHEVDTIDNGWGRGY